MLQAQVNYWNLVENAKHNRATELLGSDTLAESIRHSLATEDIERAKAREIQRHNYASETLESISNRAKMIASQASASQAETARFRAGYDYELGLGSLAVSQGQLGVAQRNAASTEEQNRLTAQRNDIAQQQVYAGMASVGIQQLGRLIPNISLKVGGTTNGKVQQEQLGAPVKKWWPSTYEY